MASKMPKKRARIDAAAAKDSTSSPSAADVGPSRCPPSQPSDATAHPKSGWSGGDAAAVDGRAPTPSGQLRAELESARRCIEQLRREKADEASRARQQTDSALRQLAERLRDERQRVIEQVRQRYAAESSRAAARHDRELQRLRDELDRCRAQLRDHVEQRGGSTDAGERARLLQKVADAAAAKRRADEALRSAVDADRQKAGEIRRLRDECRADVARVSKEANVEIRRLLEELKMKDHQLALLDRNQYPDRGVGVGIGVKLMSGDGSTTTKDQDAAAAAGSAKSDRTLKQADLLQVDDVVQAKTMSSLRADVERLTAELKTSEDQRASLTDHVNRLNHELAALRQSTGTAPSGLAKPSLTDSEVEKISFSDPKRCNIRVNGLPVKPQPKAVRFLLPGETLPVLARETPTAMDDDGTGSVNSDDVSDTASLSSASSSSSLRLSPDATSLFDENMEKNYHLLLSEHLSLQRNVANLLSSWTRTPPALSSGDEKTTCAQDCAAEKESLKATIETLKDELGMCEETANQLRQQLKDQQEQNEELEFRLFELEETAEKNKSDDDGGCSVVDLLEKNQSLEIELTVLRQKLVETATRPTDAILQLLSSSCVMMPKVVAADEHEITAETEHEDEDGGQLAVDVIEDEGARERCVVVETAADGGSDVEEDDDRLGAMTCSMSSTTSGFDDGSCASSVVGVDEMPSEETWNFDYVHEEELGGEAGAAAKPPPPPRDDESRPVVDGRTIAAEQAKQMEKIWLSRTEKLERRLVRAVDGERRARDQMALLGEEKDRRIAALERQLDALEASDFRLTKTIDALEQLERTFSRHFLRAAEPRRPHGGRARDERVGVVEQRDEDCDEKTGTDEPRPAIENGELGHPCGDEACLQCHACQTLKGTIVQLHSILAEQSEVDRRVRELEEDASDNRSSTADDQNGLEVVDFEAEYRELESLVKELKKVLVVDRSAEGCPTIGDASLSPGQRNGNESKRESVIGSLSVDAGVHWNLDDDVDDDDDDETVSMVTSPDSEIDSPVLAALNGRNRSLEISEQYLRQQVSDLEMERDQLRELVRGGEATIADLASSVARLRTSEKSTSDEATRLRAKNDWMAGRIDALLELIGRLEDADLAHRAAAGELRLRAERHSAGEADLRRELDNAVDEHARAETRSRRRLALVEGERDALASRADELAERNAELEGREAALQCRVRKLETAERGLRSELAELERALGDRTAEIVDERLLVETTCGDDDDEVQRDRDNCQTTAVIVFLKQKLEQVNRSNAALEEHLREKAACEARLRETINEYAKSDSIWQEKVVSLEAQKTTLTQKIDDLQAELTDVKGTATTAAGFEVPDLVAEDADDVEPSHWAAVEGATGVDDDQGSTETSSHCVVVEQPMDLSEKAEEENEIFVKKLNTETVEETRVETENSDSDNAKSQPLLSASPPAEPEIDSDDQQTTGSSIPTAASEPYESVSSVLLKCADRKPEVERVSVDRKLIVIRASDIRRSRSADIFRPRSVATISGPAAARAQSETRDVTDSGDVLPKTEQILALEAATTPVNSTEGDDEVERERMDDELDLTRKNKHQTTNQEAQTGSGYGAVRASLIPRIAPTHTGSGRAKTPIYCAASSSRSLIPRPVIDVISSLSSTGARGGDASQERPRSHDVRARSVSSTSSCPGISDVASDSRE